MKLEEITTDQNEYMEIQNEKDKLIKKYNVKY